MKNILIVWGLRHEWYDITISNEKKPSSPFEFNQSESTDEYESRKVSFGADYEIAEVKEVDGILQSDLHLLIEMTGKTDTEEELFQIRLDIMGVFEGESAQMNQERFLSMIKINGISTLMQLSRAYVTASTALSGFVNPIRFPMVNVYELVKRKESSI